ncbi:MAG: DUF3794 domain-containing protein [Clostridia bacterium]|nr:DUF3794 domain-containing protein [Clostridia bacterium]
MSDNNKRFSYTSRLFDRAQTCELSDDFTLPDYMPAVGRVLSCTAAVGTPTLYLGGGSAEYAGGIRYSVLYESAEDSSLWCAELPSEYDLVLSDNALPKDPSALSYLPDASAENVSARVTAPRKLTLKSRVRLSPELRTYADAETLIHGTGGNDDLKILTARADCGYYSSVSNTPITCKDRLTRAEAGLSASDEFRIISSRGDVMISHVQLSDGGAICRGEVCAHILLTREGEGERPRKMIRKIPFAETLPIGSTLPNRSQIVGVRAIGVCPSLNATATEDGIDLEATVTLSAEAASTGEITYIKDAYSKISDCESSRRKLTLPSPVACWNGNATVSSSKPLTELSLDSGMRLCDIRATLLPEIKTEISGGRFTASGKIKFCAIADNGAELIPAEFEADMKYTADLREGVDDLPLKISVTATVAEAKGRIDSDRIVCDCEIYISCLIEKEQEIDTVGEINLTPSAFSRPDSSHIRVYYPCASETLWDIAKRYRTDAELISEKNALEPTLTPDSPDSLGNAKFLII